MYVLRFHVSYNLTGLLGRQCTVIRMYGAHRKLVTGVKSFYKMQMHVLKLNYIIVDESFRIHEDVWPDVCHHGC